MARYGCHECQSSSPRRRLKVQSDLSVSLVAVVVGNGFQHTPQSVVDKRSKQTIHDARPVLFLVRQSAEDDLILGVICKALEVKDVSSIKGTKILFKLPRPSSPLNQLLISGFTTEVLGRSKDLSP